MLADKLRLCYRAIISSPTTGTQNAIFAFGWTGSYLSVSNIFGSSGTMAADASNAGTTGRSQASAATYGGDKVIIGWGSITASPYRWSSITKVSNTGILGSDENTSGIVGRTAGAAAAYGNDKAIFGFGAQQSGTNQSTNLVSNTGVMAADYVTTNAKRYSLVAAGYGGDKAIFALGRLDNSALTKFSALVSNTGVLGSDTSNVGVSDGDSVAAATFGGDKAIISFGDYRANKINIISNTGVIQADTAYVGTSRSVMSGSSYGTDKAVFGFGITSVYTSIINKVSNTGIIESDTSTVGMARVGVSAAGFGASSGGGGSGRGWYFGGWNGSASQSSVSYIEFSTDTRNLSSSQMSAGNNSGTGCNSSTHGYALKPVASGSGWTGSYAKISFSAQTIQEPSIWFAQAYRDGSGTQSSTTGYYLGGLDSTWINSYGGFLFATDAVVTVANLRTDKAAYMGIFENSSKCWLLGGSVGSGSDAVGVKIHRSMAFATNSGTTISIALTDNYSSASTCKSTDFGYVACAGAWNDNIRKMSFSSETVSFVGTRVATGTYMDGSSSSEAGYILSNVLASSGTKIITSTDTITALSASLNVYQYSTVCESGA